jgi:hypothetical protein
MIESWHAMSRNKKCFYINLILKMMRLLRCLIMRLSAIGPWLKWLIMSTISNGTNQQWASIWARWTSRPWTTRVIRKELVPEMIQEAKKWGGGLTMRLLRIEPAPWLIYHESNHQWACTWDDFSWFLCIMSLIINESLPGMIYHESNHKWTCTWEDFLWV